MDLTAARLTVRTVRWGPLGAVATVAVLLLVGVRLVSDTVPPTSAAVIVAAVVGAGVATLADPAANLLHALPTTPRRRLVWRLAALAVPGVLATGAVVSTGKALFAATWVAPGLAAAGALAATGLAVLTVAAWRAPAEAADRAALAVVAWAVAGTLTIELGGGRSLALAWWEHAAPVAVLALAVALAAADR